MLLEYIGLILLGVCFGLVCGAWVSMIHILRNDPMEYHTRPINTDLSKSFEDDKMTKVDWSKEGF